MNGIRELAWRQQYQFSKSYLLPIFNEAFILDVRQIEMGEESGLGTGANVWPAAVVLSKYLEKRFGPRGLAGKRCCELGCGVVRYGF